MKRLWDRVAKSDGCWEWQGSRSKAGYGSLSVEGVQTYTHRLAYAETYGPIPPGMNVLHHCDNPACCRPEHLFLGTNADNVADMLRKGRKRRGHAVFGSKLTEDQALEIRARAQAESVASLAREFGVERAAVRGIVNGTRWSHLGGPVERPSQHDLLMRGIRAYWAEREVPA